MGRRPRDRDNDRAAIKAAAERPLAGTPLHSPSGKPTASELITQSALRRDIVYEHTDLVQDFQARAKAQNSTPTAMQDLADTHRELKEALAKVKRDLAEERARTKILRSVSVELSLELEQAKAGVLAANRITVLPDRGPGSGL
ncbi:MULTISPECIES: hypothetical protein [Streptacidiphilus]|uniref:Uncharacterized protein n=1 Tax=Streptacidiphilus cavernicola TaxID=3342716 RepID=A0ABV6UP95_9ACTN|nr:hypothetical protein [Streptacidiphilus jeojiense]